jgi:hypothetical protein
MGLRFDHGHIATFSSVIAPWFISFVVAVNFEIHTTIVMTYNAASEDGALMRAITALDFLLRVDSLHS